MNVTAHAPIPITRVNNEYAKVFLNNAIKYAIGVAKLIGVKAVSTVRGNKKISNQVRTPGLQKRLQSPQ